MAIVRQRFSELVSVIHQSQPILHNNIIMSCRRHRSPLLFVSSFSHFSYPNISPQSF